MKSVFQVGAFLGWIGTAAGAEAGRALMPEPPALAASSLLAWALVIPALLWVALAGREAWRDDPARGRRRVRRELQRLLEELAASGRCPGVRDLERWAEGTRRLLALESAAPTRTEVTAAGGEAWGILWAEAEHRFYAPDGVLPADWAARAAAAVAGTALPKRPTPWPMRARHWLPAVAAVTMAAGMAPPLRAADGPDPTVRDAAQRPAAAVDWNAVHAERVAAYARNPAHAVTRDRLRESFVHIVAGDPGLRRQVCGRWHERWSGWCSPAGWAGIARAGAGGIAAGLAGLLLLRFHRVGRTPLRLACALVTSWGAVGAVVGYAGHRSYGTLLDGRAACVAATVELRAVPSELSPPAAGAALLPGTLVIVDRALLGWDHVVAADGKAAGWMRREAAVWIYRTREALPLGRAFAAGR